MDPVFGDGGPPAGPDKTKNTLVLVADNGATGLSASDEALQPENHPRYLPPVLWEDIQTLFDEWCKEQPHACSSQTRIGAMCQVLWFGPKCQLAKTKQASNFKQVWHNKG